MSKELTIYVSGRSVEYNAIRAIKFIRSLYSRPNAGCLSLRLSKDLWDQSKEAEIAFPETLEGYTRGFYPSGAELREHWQNIRVGV